MSGINKTLYEKPNTLQPMLTTRVKKAQSEN